MAPPENKRPRLSTASTAAIEDDAFNRVSSDDDYDVTTAIQAYAAVRPGSAEEQRCEDLREAIVLKRSQAERLKQVVGSSRAQRSSEAAMAQDKRDAHYRVMRQQLKAEARDLEAELSAAEAALAASSNSATPSVRPGEKRRVDSPTVSAASSSPQRRHGSARRAVAPAREAVLSAGGAGGVGALLARRVEAMEAEVCAMKRLLSRRQEFEAATVAERGARVEALENRVNAALRAGDADAACRLLLRLAACLSPPEAPAASRSAAPAAREAREASLRRLLRVLRFLDLGDAETRRLVRAPCAHILALVSAYEAEASHLAGGRASRGSVAFASGGAQWSKLAEIVEEACGDVQRLSAC